VAALRVGDRFPVRVPRTPLALLPFAASALVLVALFWKPPTTNAGQDKGDEASAVAPDAKAEIEDKVKKALANRAKKKPGEAPKPEDLARIEAEAERLFRKPRDTKDDVRERLKEATALEEEIKKAHKERAERAEAFKERMKQLERLEDKGQKE